MKAEDVYNQNKNLVRRIATQKGATVDLTMREIQDNKTKTNLFLGQSPIDIKLFGAQYNDIINRSMKIFKEINCSHTICYADSVGPRDIKMKCSESDKKETSNLCACVKPKRSELMSGLLDISIETTNIFKTYSPGTRKEKRELDEVLSRTSQKLSDLEKAYNNYKQKNCKPADIKSLDTEILISGTKIIKK